MTVSLLRRQTRSLTQLGQQLPMLIMLVINRPTLFVSAPLPTTLKESKSLCPLTLARHGPKTMVQLMVSAVARSHYLLTETRFSGVLPATVCKYLSTRIPSPPSLHCLLALLSLQTRRTIQSSTVLLDPNSTSQRMVERHSPLRALSAHRLHHSRLLSTPPLPVIFGYPLTRVSSIPLTLAPPSALFPAYHR